MQMTLRDSRDALSACIQRVVVFVAVLFRRNNYKEKLQRPHMLDACL
jgi:hypothetical protein